MGGPRLFESRPDDTRTEMLQATYAALQKHGYTDLTIDDIDEEFPKSKSLIYQYYSGKDELLLDFLTFMLEHFESEVQDETDLDPQERLDRTADESHERPVAGDPHRAGPPQPILLGNPLRLGKLRIGRPLRRYRHRRLLSCPVRSLPRTAISAYRDGPIMPCAQFGELASRTGGAVASL
jgi:AcrR family transcriptional regulator